MFTDANDFKIEDGFYIVKGKYVSRKGDQIDDSAIGGNPSAEDAADDGDEGSSENGINVVLDNRLKETGFGKKKEYQVYMKEYMAKVIEYWTAKGKSDDELKELKVKASTACKLACSKKFSDLQFFQGESQEENGHIAIVEWEDQDVYLYFYESGLIEEKY